MREYLINNRKFRLNILEKIENKNDAYFLGYILGDGGFHKPTYKREARLFVSSMYKQIIEHFKATYCPDTAISSKIPVNKKRPNIKSKTESHVITFSSKFSPLFKKYGLLDIKKNRRIVNISKDNFASYLNGLFDADGHVSYGIRKDRNRLWGQFGITHQSYEVLSYIQNYFMLNLNVVSSLKQRKNEDCYDLRVCKLDSVRKIYKYMYKDNLDIANTFKKNKFKDLNDQIDKKLK